MRTVYDDMRAMAKAEPRFDGMRTYVFALMEEFYHRGVKDGKAQGWLDGVRSTTVSHGLVRKGEEAADVSYSLS